MSSDTGRFDWEVILGFSIESVQSIIMTKALVIWMLLTSLAIEHRQSQLVETRKKSKEGGQGSNNTRDPYLVSDASSFICPPLLAVFHQVLCHYSNDFAIYEEYQFEQIPIDYWGTSLLNQYRTCYPVYTWSAGPLGGIQFYSQQAVLDEQCCHKLYS